MVTDESQKVSVTQSVSSCDSAWPFCKTMFLQIFYLFSYYCVNLYLTDFKDSLILKKKITIHSCRSQISFLVYVMLFEVLYLDFLSVAMKQLFKKKSMIRQKQILLYRVMCGLFFLCGIGMCWGNWMQTGRNQETRGSLSYNCTSICNYLEVKC